MPLPLSIIRIIGLVAISSHSFGQDSTDPQTKFAWSGGDTSPAICVGKPNWFVGVVPASIDITISPSASINLTGELGDATLLHIDSENRLCLFESGTKSIKATPVLLSSKEQVTPGAKLHCPRGEGNCASTLTGKEWSYRGVNFRSPLLRLRLADTVHPCQPGTPLINSDGELEGIVTNRKSEAENEVFAIPACRVRKLITEIKHHRKSGPVWIGLLFHAESSSPEVMEVKANSPSSLAGIKPGDIILGVNSKLVEDLNDLVEITQSLPAEEEATFRLLRGLQEKVITITPQFASSSLAENR